MKSNVKAIVFSTLALGALLALGTPSSHAQVVSTKGSTPNSVVAARTPNTGRHFPGPIGTVALVIGLLGIMGLAFIRSEPVQEILELSKEF